MQPVSVLSTELEEALTEAPVTEQTAEGAEVPQETVVEGEAEPETPKPAELTEVERLAVQAGWKPQGKLSAAEYFAHTAERRERIIQSRDKQLNDLLAWKERSEKTTQKLLADKEAEIHAAYKDAKRAALKADNDQLYEELEAEEQRELEAVQPPQVQDEAYWQGVAQQQLRDPVLTKFYGDNPWILEDEDAFEFAISSAQEAADRGATKIQQVRHAEEALRWKYPQLYARQAPHHAQEQPRDPSSGQFVKAEEQVTPPAPRRAPAQMAPAAKAAAKPDPVAALPPDALAEADRQIRLGRFKDRAEYAAAYNRQLTGEPYVVR